MDALAATEARLDAWAATLHDDVLQPLYALRLASGHLSVDECDGRLAAIAATVHGLIASLAPPVLADFGLVPALHVLAPTAEVVVEGVAEADLPVPTARYLYRLAQDAVARTPHPSQVHVRVGHGAARVEVVGGPISGPPDANDVPPHGRPGLEGGSARTQAAAR